jgi:hypothetical protein
MLTEAQARLETHFSSLCSERAALGYPVYALEHGMAAAEIDAFREATGCRGSSSPLRSATLMTATSIGSLSRERYRSGASLEAGQRFGPGSAHSQKHIPDSVRADDGQRTSRLSRGRLRMRSCPGICRANLPGAFMIYDMTSPADRTSPSMISASSSGQAIHLVRRASRICLSRRI